MNKVLELKTGEIVVIRHITKSDVDGVWFNFNEVVEEGNYLPVFFPVRSQLEKDSWYRNIKKDNEICIVAENSDLKKPHILLGNVKF